MNDTDASDRPRWLLELENRKRKPRLAHEAGAGAPCVLCKTSCPGLDLHFWRKICKNCKCSKDDHDVNDEDFPQFDLLFGTPRKYNKKPILLHINHEKEHVGEAFEWVPPNTTKELATDYMRALPVEKLPIKGSPGAALRRQLLQKQLPLHDIDHKICDELNDQERKQFVKYLENIKKYVGQGTVTKIISARPYNACLVTPVNATDMQQSSPQNKPSLQLDPVHLRTPSSFTSKCLYKKGLHEGDKVQGYAAPAGVPRSSSDVGSTPIIEQYSIIGNNGDIVNSEPVVRSVYGKGVELNLASENYDNGQALMTELPTIENVKSADNATNANFEAVPSCSSTKCYDEAYNDTLKVPPADLLHSTAIDESSQLAEAMLANALLPPSAVHANDIIRSTLDEKGLRSIREKLTNKYGNQENVWPQYNVPGFAKGLDAPNVPFRGVKETDNRILPATRKNQHASLIPLQEAAIQTAKRSAGDPAPMNTEKQIVKQNSKVARSSSLAPNQASSTGQFGENVSAPLPVSASQVHLQSPSINNQHAELNSFTTPATILHSKQLQTQIFPCEVIVGTSRHPEHDYTCTKNLTSGMEELTIGRAKQQCHKCQEEIRIGDVAIITEKAENTAWHPGCFTCDTCNELLADLVYFYYKNKLYCGRDLAALLGIPRCYACDELIFLREYTVAEGHNYHVKHFCCWDCDIPLAGKQYITENDRPLCLLCYQKTYAKTCDMCDKVIAADQQGVAVKDLNFHATGDCFCCYICKRNLLNGRFAVKEKKIFCSKACISTFLNT